MLWSVRDVASWWSTGSASRSGCVLSLVVRYLSFVPFQFAVGGLGPDSRVVGEADRAASLRETGPGRLAGLEGVRDVGEHAGDVRPGWRLQEACFVVPF